MAVSDKDTLPVFHLIALSREIQVCRSILQTHRESLCQLTAGIYLSIKDRRHSTASRLSQQVAFYNRFYIVFKRHHHRSTIVQYNDQIRIILLQHTDHFQLCTGQIQMLTVKSLCLIAFRKSHA